MNSSAPLRARGSRGPDTLVATDIGLREVPSGLALTCRLERPGGSLPAEVPSTLWFELPPGIPGPGGAAGDPFLPVLLVAAMRWRISRLVLEADVSPLLLDSSRRIAGIYHEWSRAGEDSLGLVEISAPAAQHPRRGVTSGAFFSCGVDSFFTVLRNLARYREGDARRITHLILIHGSDVALERTALFALVLEHARAAAEGLARSLVVVRTNARGILASVDWSRYGYAPVLASVGLALGGLFHTMFIPSGRGVLEPFRPTASHPGVDPLWSTEGVEFVTDGADSTRPDKARLIATSELALRHLRVCWENRDGAYNCGRCEKCLRTMVTLKLAGALGRGGQFPARLAPADFDRMDVGQPDRWVALLGRIRSSGLDPLEWAGIAEAIERALVRWSWSRSRLGRLDAALSKVLASVGLTPQRARAIDARLLGSTGVKAYRWLSNRGRKSCR